MGERPTGSELSGRAIDRLLGAAAEAGHDLPGPAGVDLGPYRLQEEVGRGAMGVVYEAVDGRFGRRVALKLLAQARSFVSPVLRERFLREAQAVAKLTHPNIAAVYDATQDYIAMQFVEGRSLDRVPLLGDPRRAVELLVDAAGAVHHAHVQGVVHRDLKPSNLMLDQSAGDAGRLYVTDFGLARVGEIDSSLSRSGDVLGTPAFMAPEQVTGRADERSDVYGLGATLYALLADRPPFAGDDVLAVLQQVGEQEPPTLRSLCRGRVDQDLHTIVHKCLSKEPERRYPTALALAEDLSRWLAGEPIAARPPSAPYRLQKFLQRRRSTVRVAAVVGVVLLGVLLVSVWFVVQQRAGREGAEAALRLGNQVHDALADSEDLFRSGKVEELRQCLESAVLLCRGFLEEHDLPQVHFLLGKLLRRQRKFALALDELTLALEGNPELFEAQFERGLLLAEYMGLSPYAGGPDPSLLAHYHRQAVVDLGVVRQRAISFRRRDVLFGEAELARLEGDHDTATERLRQIADDLQPTYLPALLGLARLALQAGDEKQAQLWSSRAVDMFRGFGPFYRPGGGVNAATPICPSTQVPLFNSQDLLEGRVPAEAILLRAMARLSRGDFDGARADFGRVTQKDPRRGVAWQGLGRVQLELSRIHAGQGRRLPAIAARLQALAHFDRALAADPKLGGAWLGRGEVRLLHAAQLQQGGLQDEARTWRAQAGGDLEQARKLGPTAVREQAQRLLASGR